MPLFPFVNYYVYCFIFDFYKYSIYAIEKHHLRQKREVEGGEKKGNHVLLFNYS